MQKVEKWLWRIRWARRSTTTRVHFTEAEIRTQHPEAERIDASRMEVELPETAAGIRAALRQRGDR